MKKTSRVVTHLENDTHDLAVDLSAANSEETPAPYSFQRVMLRQAPPARCQSPTPPSSAYTSEDEDDSEYYYHQQQQQEKEYYNEYARQQQKMMMQQQQMKNAARPASPVKQESVPRAHSSRSPSQQQHSVHYDVNNTASHPGVPSPQAILAAYRRQHVVTPSAHAEVLRELDESLDKLQQLHDNNSSYSSSSSSYSSSSSSYTSERNNNNNNNNESGVTAASSSSSPSHEAAVESALQEVCDKLEFLSEIVLSHERRIAKAENIAADEAASPQKSQELIEAMKREASENKQLVHSILHKVDAVENLMHKVRSNQNSPAASSNTPAAAVASSSSSPTVLAASSASSRNSNEESAMKTISRQLTVQNELLAQVVLNQNINHLNNTPTSTLMQSATRRALMKSVDAEDDEVSETASIADEMSPPELSVPRERTPEALAVTRAESARRRLIAGTYEEESTASEAEEEEEYSVPRERTPEALAITRAESARRRLLAGDYEESSEDSDDREYVPFTYNVVNAPSSIASAQRRLEQQQQQQQDYEDDQISVDIQVEEQDNNEERMNTSEEMGDNASPRRQVYAAVDAIRSAPRQRTVLQTYQGEDETNSSADMSYDDYDEEEEASEATAEYYEDDEEQEEEMEDDEDDLYLDQFFVSPARQHRMSPVGALVASSPLPVSAAALLLEDEDEDDEEEEQEKEEQQLQQQQEEEIHMSARQRRFMNGGESTSNSSASASAGSTPNTGSRNTSSMMDSPSTRRAKQDPHAVLDGATTPQPIYLIRSAVRHDALSAQKQPEVRQLFDYTAETDSSSDDEDDEEVQRQQEEAEEIEAEKEQIRRSIERQEDAKLKMERELLARYRNEAEQQQQQQQQDDSTVEPTESSFTASVADSVDNHKIYVSNKHQTVTVPMALLQRLVDEVEELRKHNQSLEGQLQWALARTDAVSERLLELSPCH